MTVTEAVDRVTFTHVDPDITFPMPRPIGLIDAYVVYVGFDATARGAAKEKAGGKAQAGRPQTGEARGAERATSRADR